MASTSKDDIKESIREYFLSHHCKVKDEVFSKHFRQSIREHREDCRLALNALTTIEKIDQTNYFVLKPEFRNMEYEERIAPASIMVYNEDDEDNNDIHCHASSLPTTKHDDNSNPGIPIAVSDSFEEDVPTKKTFDKSYSVPPTRDDSLTTISEDSVADGSINKYDSLDRTPKISTITGYGTTSKRRASKGTEYTRTPNRKKSSITTVGTIGRSTTDDGKGRISLRRKPSGNGAVSSPSTLRSTKISTVADLTAISEEQPIGELIDGDADSIEDDYYYGLETEEHDWMRWSSMCNIHLLKTLLEKDSSLLDRRDFVSGYTALHWAAKQGNASVIEFLCKHGADTNIRSNGGYTPLHLALMHNHEDIAKLLIIKYKADPSIRDYSGKRPGSFMNLHSTNANRKKDSITAAPNFASTAIAIVAAAALPGSPVTSKKSISTI